MDRNSIEEQAGVWHCPQEYQGQIVVIEYAEVEGGLARRTTDTSCHPNDPERVSYEYGAWNEDSDEPFEPWNRVPSDGIVDGWIAVE